MNDKMMTARCRLITKNPWYGIFCSNFTYKRDDNIKTMCVSMNSSGITLRYSGEFVDGITIDETIAVLQHEVEHIVRLHLIRWFGRDQRIWNIATDAVINGRKKKPNIKGLPKIVISFENGEKVEADCVWYEHPEDNLTAEEYYEWLIKNGNKIPTGADVGSIDDHSSWAESTVSEGQAQQMVRSICDQCSKQAGLTPGHLKDAIESLRESKIDWRHVLRRIVGRNAGNRRYTMSRVHRRNPRFGVKGVSHRSNVPMNVLVDTSGSVSKELLEQFFTEIESVSSKYKVRLIQFDAAVHSDKKYRRGDWKEIEITGRGGTSFGAALSYLEENKIVGKLNVVLTDGYCKWPDEKDYYVVWCIQGNDEVPPFGDHVVIPA